MTDTLRFGRYESLRLLARGGMGAVHLVRLVGAGKFERKFALKVCYPHLADQPEFVARFLDEAGIAARIHHPNVVPTLDVVRDGDLLYLVMEYVDGPSLHALIQRADAIPASIAVRIVIDTLDGLEAAHTLTDANGAPLAIIHRDVSPHNVLVGRDGVARVVDFGVARAADNSAHSRTDELKGKLRYIAPEQINGGALDCRVDVFAAGVVLWELLAKRRFRSSADIGAAVSEMLGPPTPPSTHVTVDPRLDEVVVRALAVDPAARYASAKDLADALRAIDIAATTQEVATFVARFADEPDEDADEPDETSAVASIDRGRSSAPVVAPVPVGRSGHRTETIDVPVARGHVRRRLGTTLVTAAVVATIGVAALFVRPRSNEDGNANESPKGAPSSIDDPGAADIFAAAAADRRRTVTGADVERLGSAAPPGSNAPWPCARRLRAEHAAERVAPEGTMTGHRFVIALAIFLAAPRAFAQDPHAVAELTAKEAFALGDAAYDRHDWTTAITQYRRSMALLPSPNSRLLVARCLSHLGRNAEALTEYEITVDEASQRAERDPRYATTRDVARDEAGPLRAKVGFVRIAARNLPPASVVRIDGKTIPPEAYDLEVPHDPGPIDVAITGPHVASRHDALTIGAGAKLDVPPSPLAVYTPPVAAAPPPPSARHPLRALGIGGLVVGGAGLVGAVVLGAVTDHTYRSDRDRCRSERCTDADVQSGRTLATATYVSLGVGIAFAAAGASLLLLDKKSAATSAWTGSWRF